MEKIRHIVMWNFSNEFSADQSLQNANRIKTELEALEGVIDGLLKIVVVFPIKENSDFDIMLDSLFENDQALIAYQSHPEHLKVVGFIKQALRDRKCIDYFV